MAGLHAVQGLLIIILGSDFAITVTSNFLDFNESTQSLESATKNLFDMPFVWLIAGFLFLSAGAHLFIATLGNKTYTNDLKKGMNRYRWYEYSLSASIMMVAIAMLSGVYDLASLVMIFGLTSVMNLMGLMMEVHNQILKKVNWLSYYIGVLAGILPWVAIATYFTSAASSEGGGPPTFVYFIYGSIFLFFNSFAINMVLQYMKVGKWKDYLYGERVYIILSLVAKSALAWQVYAGTLQP
jgi:hypothetical protein